ncbi:hypothetical protein QR680_008250 [Steinernema hermaphroditum]|uniref:Uncharacterized protein n=1 Tax=Steinernema hermaphroditum TaxID=289476 RepID=A0AA39II49_9BILA|nr:hypothetical protein QR680_008250 [Steinernema hermaphroditum]
MLLITLSLSILIKVSLLPYSQLLLIFGLHHVCLVLVCLRYPKPESMCTMNKTICTDDLQKLAKEDGVWVPVDDFIQLVQPKAISDWQSSCGIDLCKQ